MQVDKRLLQPARQQSRALCRLALVQQAEQRCVFVCPLNMEQQISIRERQIERLSHHVTRGFGEVQSAERTGIEPHELCQIMRSDGICAVV